MGKEKISKFICKLRKEKNLTQQELADRLYVSDKAVSKWEREICLPDVTIFENLAEILGVSVAELIAGERIKDNEKLKKTNLILAHNLKENIRVVKSKNKIIAILFSIIVLILFILIIFLINGHTGVKGSSNNEKTIKNSSNYGDGTYAFVGETENFIFENGKINFTKKNGMFELSNFNLSDNSSVDGDGVKTAKIRVYFDNKEWGGDDYTLDDGDFNIWLNETYLYEGVSYPCRNGYENCGVVISAKIDKNEFPNNMKIEINYCTKNNKCEKETFEVSDLILQEDKSSADD